MSWIFRKQTQLDLKIVSRIPADAWPLRKQTQFQKQKTCWWIPADIVTFVQISAFWMEKQHHVQTQRYIWYKLAHSFSAKMFIVSKTFQLTVDTK